MNKGPIAVALAVLAVLAAIVMLVVRRDAEEARKQPSAGARAGSGGAMAGGGGARRPQAPILPSTSMPIAGAGRSFAMIGYGSGPGQVGARAADESNPEGPMAILATSNGLLVLDQVNARIQRFDKDGKPIGSIPIGPDTAQDIAVDDKGRVAVLDRVHEGQVLSYDENGNLIGQAPVQGGPLTEAGGSTAVFINDSGTYVEREHGEIVQVLGPSGTPVDDRGTKPGRPLRDGTGYIQALLADQANGIATVRRFNATSDFVWQRSVRFPAPIISLVLLDSDRQGRIFVAAHIANEQPEPPHDLLDERIIVVGMGQSDGADRGSLVLPPPAAADESMRPLTVGDEGTIYQMLPGPSGMEIRAYPFP